MSVRACSSTSSCTLQSPPAPQRHARVVPPALVPWRPGTPRIACSPCYRRHHLHLEMHLLHFEDPFHWFLVMYLTCISRMKSHCGRNSGQIGAASSSCCTAASTTKVSHSFTAGFHASKTSSLSIGTTRKGRHQTMCPLAWASLPLGRSAERRANTPAHDKPRLLLHVFSSICFYHWEVHGSTNCVGVRGGEKWMRDAAVM